MVSNSYILSLERTNSVSILRPGSYTIAYIHATAVNLNPGVENADFLADTRRPSCCNKKDRRTQT